MIIPKLIVVICNVRGNFNIYRTRFFFDGKQHPKDILRMLFSIKKRFMKAFSVITNHAIISWKGRSFFGQPKLQEAYNIIHLFFTFDGKQHAKNIWFRG